MLTAPTVPLVPVGFQNEVNYKNFQLGVATNLGLPVSVAPLGRASPPNDALVSVRNDVQTGDVSVSPSATAFQDGNIKFFSLDSFFFGCSGQVVMNAADVATSCVVSVTAYDINDKMVGEETYTFAPAVLTNAPLVKAVLPSQFVELKNFTMAIASGALSPALTVLAIDSVTRTNYY